MLKPGRKSAASLAVVTSIAPNVQRLRAPNHLSATALTVWNEVIASRAPQFFDEASRPLLETYCVATAEHRRLAVLLYTLDPILELDKLSKLTRLMDMHSLRIGAAATKLRLSIQSRYDAQKAATLSRDSGSPTDRIRANYRINR